MVTLLRRRVVSPATDCEEWHRTLYECIVIPLNSLDASSFGGWCSQPATDVVLVKYPSQQWSLWVWSGYYEPTRTGFSLCSAHLLLRSCPTLGTVRQTEPIGLIGVVFTGWMPFMLPKKTISTYWGELWCQPRTVCHRLWLASVTREWREPLQVSAVRCYSEAVNWRSCDCVWVILLYIHIIYYKGAVLRDEYITFVIRLSLPFY